MLDKCSTAKALRHVCECAYTRTNDTLGEKSHYICVFRKYKSIQMSKQKEGKKKENLYLVEASFDFLKIATVYIA